MAGKRTPFRSKGQVAAGGRSTDRRIRFWNKRNVAVVDRLMMCASVLHPLSAAPQVYEIYASQNASGVSLLTWMGFLLIGCVFLSYGLSHRLKPYIINQLVWFVLDVLVIIGIFLYG